MERLLMLTNWEKTAEQFRRRRAEDRSSFSPYAEMAKWRRRARFYIILWLLTVAALALAIGGRVQ
jgi:hypothetical protein